MKFKNRKTIFTVIIVTSFLLSFQTGRVGLIGEKKDTELHTVDNFNNKLPESASLAWVVFPTLSAKYFSPGGTLGTGDTVMHYFSVNSEADYNLNVSAYYEFFDLPNAKGVTSGIAAFLMENGTWIVIVEDWEFLEDIRTLHMGIGTNVTTMRWQEIGQVNKTVKTDIAAQGSSIRFVYLEADAGNDYVEFIRCYSSDDFGMTWRNETIWNCTEWEGPVWVPSVTLGVHNDDFECVWVLANISDMNPIARNLTTIWESRDNGAGWSQAANLTALEGINARTVQFLSNGTAYLGVQKINTTVDYKENYVYTDQTVIYELSGLSGIADSWNITDLTEMNWELMSGPDYFEPPIYLSLDYTTDEFYFVESDDFWIATANWSVSSQNFEYDYFQPEIAKTFQLFGDGGPKCYTSRAFSDSGLRKPGILDVPQPFLIRNISYSTSSNALETFVFDGKDERGQLQQAKSYSFTLQVNDSSEVLEDVQIAYIDHSFPEISYSNTSEYISPFTSLGTNDGFTVNITSNKPGTAQFFVRSDSPTLTTTFIQKPDSTMPSMELCAERTNQYLFYTSKPSGNRELKFARSLDGGITWDDPKVIGTTTSPNWWNEKVAVVVDGNPYLFVKTQGSSLGPTTVYFSPDKGITFLSYGIREEVQAATGDSALWRGGIQWNSFPYKSIYRSREHLEEFHRLDRGNIE